MKDVKIEEILLVKDFQVVFPQELPGMQLDIEIEFIMHMIWKTSLIDHPPYRMVQGIAGMKAQLDELED